VHLKDAMRQAHKQSKDHDVMSIHAIDNDLGPATVLNVYPNKAVIAFMGDVRGGPLGIDQIASLLDNPEGWEVASIPF
jgi:hypothetical protein